MSCGGLWPVGLGYVAFKEIPERELRELQELTIELNNNLELHSTKSQKGN